jgi:tripartite-type tricarboxylate transporter receptor subunit TctC
MIAAAAMALCAFSVSDPAEAQDWPQRTVRVIVPYPAGGNADVIGRIVAQALQEGLKQPFVIENKTGAGGIIGAVAVKNAEPDGYTLLFSADGPILFAPELVPQRPYQWDTAFAPVSTVSLTPLVLVVNPKLPLHSLKDFIDDAREHPRKLTFASGGLGTSNHLFSEYMQSLLNVEWTTVQYRGTAPAMADLMGGNVQFSIDQVSSAVGFIRKDAVRALAVTSETRSPALPEVPTMAELGYKNLVGNTFTAFMAPKATPNDVVKKLHAALVTALSDPTLVQRIEALGAVASMMEPDDFKDFLIRESSTWTPIVRRLHPN